MTPSELADMLRAELEEHLQSVRKVADWIEAMEPVRDRWCWPLHPQWTRITGRFRDNRGTWDHEGLDISVTVGQPVYAPHGGIVVSAKFNSAYGNRVRFEWMEEGERWSVWLAHLVRWTVKEGQAVLPGDLVGYSGNTGNSTGPHLHVTVQRESNKDLMRGLPEVLRGCVDPLLFIKSLEGGSDKAGEGG